MVIRMTNGSRAACAKAQASAAQRRGIGSAAGATAAIGVMA
jgi:hypothetical protein